MTLKAAPYGRDTRATNRIYRGRLSSGNRLLGEAAYRRLTTNRGQLLYDPNYGLHLATLLGKDMTPAEVQSVPGRIRNELLKDDRLADARIRLSRNGAQWFVDIELVPADSGPFRLVLGIEDVSVSILREAA